MVEEEQSQNEKNICVRKRRRIKRRRRRRKWRISLWRRRKLRIQPCILKISRMIKHFDHFLLLAGTIKEEEEDEKENIISK